MSDVYASCMPLFHGFKQGVLDLGRGEAKTKARPLTIGDESLDRSAAGLDNRRSERVVQFWLLSDRALFMVVGTDRQDHAYRIPFEAIAAMTLDFDENAEFLPWYIRVGVDPDGSGTITKLEPGTVPGQPLTTPPPIPVSATSAHDSHEARSCLLRGLRPSRRSSAVPSNVGSSWRALNWPSRAPRLQSVGRFFAGP